MLVPSIPLIWCRLTQADLEEVLFNEFGICCLDTVD